ncbi:MAG: hypothetical protein IKO35_04500, partial [Elusimicrobiaceae bacterium]|nr:hypothetical protein [Elusimicrobiaceae bacterium]
FPNQTVCTDPTYTDYCVKTKYFEITIYDGYVDAVRKKGSANGDYAVRVYSTEFGSNTRTEPVCIYGNDAGKDLCISMKYSSCDVNSFICSRP